MAKGSGSTKYVGSSQASAANTTTEIKNAKKMAAVYTANAALAANTGNPEAAAKFKAQAAEEKAKAKALSTGNRQVTDSEFNSLSKEAKSHVSFARDLGDGTLNSAIRSAKIQVEMFEEQYGKNPTSKMITDFMGHKISADMQYKHLRDIVSELEKLKKK